MREGMEKRFGNDHEVWKHFDAYKMKFSMTFPNQKPGLKKLDSPGLYQNFDRILHDPKPKRHYVFFNCYQYYINVSYIGCFYFCMAFA